MICSNVNTDLQIYVRECNTGKEAWENLAGHFEEKTLSKKIYWWKKLFSLRMDKNTNMETHVNNVKTIAEHLEALGKPIAEDELVMVLISSLSEDYNNLVYCSCDSEGRATHVDVCERSGHH